MIVEWEVILNCNYKCEYCVNSRNSALPQPIYHEKDKEKVFKFIENLKKNYPNEELFLFGGEPFLHPFLSDIILKLNEVQMKFIIQSNGSIPYVINKTKGDFEIQISVHPTQIKDKDQYIKDIIKLKDKIRRLDIMYVGDESLDYFKKFVNDFKDKIVMKPLADFKYTNCVNNHLYEFNKIKETIKGKVYKFEEGERSYLWEQQMKNEWTPKGLPCPYKDTYVLYDPMLNKYNCSYRQNNEVCPNDHCFLM